MRALFPYAIVLAALLPVVSIGGAVLFRNRLPRLFLIWVLVALVFVYTGAAFAGIYAYREIIPPRYQEEILTQAPFMRAFMRPTPAGGVVPTVASTSAIAPEDLLSMSLSGGTEEPSPATNEATDAVEQVEATTTPTPTPTLEPTAVSAAPSEVPVFTSVDSSNTNSSSRPMSVINPNFRHQQQTWNNCGPANITMALSYYGWQEDQQYAASLIRPNREDKNVSPQELVAFVNENTFVKAIWRVGGDMELLKDLVAANFPVVIETGGPFAEGYDWIGHYQTVVGYDDNLRQLYLYDSFLGTGTRGEGLAESYDIFDDRWQDFNRVFIVIYEPDRESALTQILGEYADPLQAAQIALETAQAEAPTNPNDPVPWFNMGTAFLRLGLDEQAAAAYDAAIQRRLPFRMIWYQFGIFEAYFNVGRYGDVSSIAQSVINDSGRNVEEAYYWQGRALEAQGSTQQAIAAYNSALNVNPLFADAREALDTLNA
jgi:tetratricopeptide (TPR) repeat protein